MAQCGTYAGYQEHVRYGQPTCDECRSAARAYMREYRSKDAAGGYARSREQMNLRTRALRILGQRHPAELRQIVDDLRGSDG